MERNMCITSGDRGCSWPVQSPRMLMAAVARTFYGSVLGLRLQSCKSSLFH